MWYLFPNSVSIPSLVSWTVSLSRVAVNPASRNWQRDRRGFCSAGKTSHFWADRESWRNGIRAVCVANMVSPFYMRTRFPPYRNGTLLSHGQILESKWLLQPELANVSSKGGVTMV